MIKPVGRMFEISNSNPTRGKHGRSLSPQKNNGLKKFHSERKTRKIRRILQKMRNMRLTGIIATLALGDALITRLLKMVSAMPNHRPSSQEVEGVATAPS